VKLDFRHRHSAHCESGVTSNLLSHYGFELSETLSFGIGSGLFFGYLPFVRINNYPLAFYRNFPGGLLRRVSKRLGVKLKTRTFRNKAKAEDVLDRALASGSPVGVQAGVYWLPYFPPALRFHFNAHHLVVYGKEGDEYLISDPVIDEPVTCASADLLKARFAEGQLSPKGRVYLFANAPRNPDYGKAVQEGIKEVCSKMLNIPFPLLGVKGIRFLSREIVKWPSRLGNKKARYYLGHIVRMQEEIGTGGGGFRFMYSAFLQEASEILGLSCLSDISSDMTEVGDMWREFGLMAVRICKSREGSSESYPELAEMLLKCADREERIFRDIRGCLKLR
jgi:hypothetical protein